MASRKSSALDEDLTPEEVGAQAAANMEVAGLMAQVQALSSAAAPEEADDEASDQVNIGDHMDLAGLTLDHKDETHSGASSSHPSAANSVQASPAVGSSASASALHAMPPVELHDGGSASALPADASSSSDAPIAKTDFFDVRVAVVGNVDSGKSTLIGVLTGGTLDDGRGKARSKVFIHAHELGTGRTSAISQHIMGFDTEGKPVHQPVAASAQSVAKTKSWAHVVAASRSVMTFVDLAGHERYLSTTIAGLTGSHPDYAMVIVNSLAGVTKMTKEHLGVVLALEIPLICVVTKVDLVPTTVLESSKKQLFRILKSSAANKLPMQMRSAKDVDTVIENSTSSTKICPVFFISAVNGTHVDLLTSYLSRLKPHLEWLQQHAKNMSVTRNPDGTTTSHPNAVEFAIDEIFSVSGVGIVVSGTLASGVLHANSTLLLGPQSDNSFIQVLVRSLHFKRVTVESVSAGQSCAISIRAVKRKETLKRPLLRRGMVLVDPIVQPRSTRIFDAEVIILHHSTSIKMGYQAVLHCGMIRQTAAICRIQKRCLRTGDKSVCRFRFLQREEYLHAGQSFVFREGTTKGIGKITRIEFTDAEKEELEEEERARRKQGGKSQQHPNKHSADAEGEDMPAAAAVPSAASAPAAAASASASAAPAASAARKEPAASAATASSAASSTPKEKWSQKEKLEYQQQKAGHK